MKRFVVLTGWIVAGLAFGVATAMADPIEGMWRTGDDALLKISQCGSAFCVDVAEGKHIGKRSGQLAKQADGSYTGTLKQFSTGLSFKGIANLDGNSMKLVAKALGITVKTDQWTRQ